MRRGKEDLRNERMRHGLSLLNELTGLFRYVVCVD